VAGLEIEHFVQRHFSKRFLLHRYSQGPWFSAVKMGRRNAALGQQRFCRFSGGASGYHENGWTGEAWEFAAPESGDYTLAISAGVGTYPAIDNLSLTEYSAVPEPAAASWMMGCAVLAVAAQRARRSRSTWRVPSHTAAV
jgi:hypothetical protein